MVIDTDPMCSKMIRVSNDVHELIVGSKIIPQEPHGDCIKRIIKENQQFKKIYFTTQTRERMEADIKNFVLNPDVPATPSNSHREIWMAAHPGETLTQDDLIHHINGNHDDNRIENLQKVSAKEHAIAHASLNPQSIMTTNQHTY
jgi:hypothetical protein